ncbi:MAG: hypothetical protein QGG40_08110, partial [Myxococcota bacterium]|nr:hypothetical protein [Myxococcota bacterium]
MRRTDNLWRSMAWSLLVPWAIVSCEEASTEPEQTVEVSQPPPTTGTIQVQVVSPGAQDRSWPAPPDGCEGGRAGQVRTNRDGQMEGVAVWISERLEEEESEDSETEEEAGSAGEQGSSSAPVPEGGTNASAFFALEDCRPVPSVQVVTGNSALEIANRDNIDHGLELGAQTHEGPWGTSIDLGPQSTGVLTLPEEGLVHIQCP